MKRIITFMGLMMLLSFSLIAQKKPYNVVFDLTSKDSFDQKAVIRWMREIT